MKIKSIREAGVRQGGAGNFNLVTKVLDLVASDFNTSGQTIDLVMKLPGVAVTADSTVRKMMVNSYGELRKWWGNSDLTRIGLTPR